MYGASGKGSVPAIAEWKEPWGTRGETGKRGRSLPAFFPLRPALLAGSIRRRKTVDGEEILTYCIPKVALLGPARDGSAVLGTILKTLA